MENRDIQENDIVDRPWVIWRKQGVGRKVLSEEMGKGKRDIVVTKIVLESHTYT